MTRDERRMEEFKRDMLVGDVTRAVYNLMHGLKNPTQHEIEDVKLALTQLASWTESAKEKEVAHA